MPRSYTGCWSRAARAFRRIFPVGGALKLGDNVMKRLIALGVFGLFVAGLVMAARSLPWWALGLGFLALIVVGKIVIGNLLGKLLLVPFRAKGAVLKGASILVHRVSSVAGPETAESTEPGARDLAHYLLDVTITPEASDGPFGLWEPGELCLVRPESRLRLDSDEADDEDDACEVTRIQFEDSGQWNDDDGMKYPGAQRLRLNLAVRPGTRELKFRYYFEEFGRIELPPVAEERNPAA